MTSVRTDNGGFIVETEPPASASIASSPPLRHDSPRGWRLSCRGCGEIVTSGVAHTALSLVLALDRPLTSVYWLNVNDPGFPFMPLVEHANYMPAADYGGRHLVYLGNYRPMGDPLMSASKEVVLDEFLPHLARLNPAFDRSLATDSWASSAPFAQLIVTVDYRDDIPPFRTPIPNLWTASLFQVYSHDREQNYSIALADRLVQRMGSDS